MNFIFGLGPNRCQIHKIKLDPSFLRKYIFWSPCERTSCVLFVSYIGFVTSLRAITKFTCCYLSWYLFVHQHKAFSNFSLLEFTKVESVMTVGIEKVKRESLSHLLFDGGQYSSSTTFEMFNENKSIVPVLHTSHEHPHHSDEIIFVFFENIESLIGLISPEYILELKISNHLFIIQILFFFVVLEQCFDESIELWIRRILFRHCCDWDNLLLNRLKKGLVFNRFALSFSCVDHFLYLLHLCLVSHRVNCEIEVNHTLWSLFQIP